MYVYDGKLGRNFLSELNESSALFPINDIFAFFHKI